MAVELVHYRGWRPPDAGERHRFRESAVHFGAEPPGDRQKQAVVVAGGNVAKHDAKPFWSQDGYRLVNLRGLACTVPYAGAGNLQLARKRLRRNEVCLLILDPGLNVEKDNREKPPAELAKAVSVPHWTPPRGVEAYQAACLAPTRPFPRPSRVCKTAPPGDQKQLRGSTVTGGRRSR